MSLTYVINAIILHYQLGKTWKEKMFLVTAYHVIPTIPVRMAQEANKKENSFKHEIYSTCWVEEESLD